MSRNDKKQTLSPIKKESYGDMLRRESAEMTAKMVERTEKILAGEIQPEYDAVQKRRHEGDARRDAEVVKRSPPHIHQPWCRRCDGPVADGSGICGEC